MSIYTESTVYSFFARKNISLIDRTPQRVVDSFPVKEEDCMAIHKEDIELIMGAKYKGTDPNTLIRVYPLKRTKAEYLSDMVQIVGVACIHDQTNTLLLRLVKDTPILNYRDGSITYIQGHCDFDMSFAQVGNPYPDHYYSISEIMKKVKQDIFREIQEEVTIDSEMLRTNFLHDVGNIIAGCGMKDIYPIYINSPGSMEVHLCILFDIDMSGTKFATYMDKIHTNEPLKHDVRIMTYEDLLQLARADQICPWLARSFSQLPFYTTTFIEKYLKENPSINLFEDTKKAW